MMIPRHQAQTLRERLHQFPAVALLGPRQVGKTTLARSISRETGGVYLDLESAVDREKLYDARGYLVKQRGRLVILDEIQRAPNLFEELRGLIDEAIQAGHKTGQFLLLGSASIDLLKQSSESLAGRIAYLELGPFDVLELAPEQEAALWIRGGFPQSFLAETDSVSAIWRSNFIRTYLERDIPLLGPRIPSETLRRFWTMLAHAQGSLLNSAQLARGLAVDGKTVAKYLDLMVDLLLVRRLPPHHSNVGKRLVRSPKTYLRDSGVVHTLLRLDDEEAVLGHPIAGMSWEGFSIETLLRVAPERAEASFYRTAAGAEIDLLLQLPGNEIWAIEVKRGTVPRVERGFHLALEDLAPDRAFIIYSGQERYPKGEGIEAIGLREMASLLAVR